MSHKLNLIFISSDCLWIDLIQICLENSLIRLLMNWSVWFEKFLDHQKPMLLQSNICLEILDSEFLRNTYKFRLSLETNVTFINSICLENSLIRFLMNRFEKFLDHQKQMLLQSNICFPWNLTIQQFEFKWTPGDIRMKFISLPINFTFFKLEIFKSRNTIKDMRLK